MPEGESLMNGNREPLIFDTSDGQELRINTINTYLKRRFGQKTVKLSIDGGFTCPNRDGSKGYGGCLFCSAEGSGDMADGSGDIKKDLENQIALLSGKWPDAAYIAYFQSHTNTYAPAALLRKKYMAAISHPGIKGIAIATRPDCIPDDVLDLLCEVREKTFMWVELGLQTIHSSTAEAMNLCYTLADYEDALSRLMSKKIPVVTHLILGLPGESREMMLQSVRYAGGSDIFGIKLHMLNLVRGSAMEKSFPGYVSFDSMDEYVDLVISALELISPRITVHRITADAPRATLISPWWSYKKRTLLNTVHKEMKARDTWQGRLYSSGPSRPSL